MHFQNLAPSTQLLFLDNEPLVFRQRWYNKISMSIRNLVYFLAGALLLWSAGCSTVPVAPEGSGDLKALCEQYHVQWYMDNVSHVINLRSAGREAQALVGSSVVVVNGEKVFLSDMIRRDQGMVIVPADFTSKVILHIAGGGMVSRQGFHIIVDAGHGGKDPGTHGRTTGIEEKEVTLDIARRLRKDLESRGVKVTMTRDRDEFISLEQRTEIATRSKADLFISIHANSNPSRSVDGIEVYALRDLEGAEKHDPQRIKNQRAMFRNLAMRSGDMSLEAIVADMLYNYKLSESQLLAAYVDKGATNAVKANNRGVKRAGYHVLRNTLIPAVLVEVGFLSNPAEERMLRDTDYREKIADGIASSLVSFAEK